MKRTIRPNHEKKRSPFMADVTQEQLNAALGAHRVRYVNDCAHIARVAGSHGLGLLLKDAETIWEWFKNCARAGSRSRPCSPTAARNHARIRLRLRSSRAAYRMMAGAVFANYARVLMPGLEDGYRFQYAKDVTPSVKFVLVTLAVGVNDHAHCTPRVTRVPPP